MTHTLTTKTDDFHENRKYKDNLFRLIFNEKDAFGYYPDRVPCLEFKATFININYGNNQQLMARCRKLSDYATFVHLIRSYIDVGLTLAQAAEQTINECIKNNIMKDFLLKHRGEVTNVVLSTYYKEVHEKGERDFYKDYGKKLHLISQVQKKFQKNLNAFAIAESLEESVETINQIMHTIKDNPDADLEHLYYLIYRQ